MKAFAPLLAVSALSFCAGVQAGGTSSVLPLATSHTGLPPGWTAPPSLYGVGTTRNVQLVMDDGVVLSANVSFPTLLDSNGKPVLGQDGNPAPAPGPFPTIVTATPYGHAVGSILDGFGGGDTLPAGLPGQDLGELDTMVKRGYIDVIFDIRGTGESGGYHDLLSPRQTQDTIAVINWASKLPRSTGKVGMFGESYLGLTQWLAAGNIGPNSPLKAIFPIFAGNDMYREVVAPGGLYNTEVGVVIMTGIFVAEPDLDTILGLLLTNPALCVKLLLEHTAGDFKGGVLQATLNVLSGKPDYAYENAGSYWEQRSPRSVMSQVVANGIPAYMIGGQYDIFQHGEFSNFTALQNAWASQPVNGPMSAGQPVSGNYQILWGPWFHVLPGESQTPKLDIDMEDLATAWYDHWLKGVDNGIDRVTTPVHAIDVGGHAIEATRFPLTQTTAQNLYLDAKGVLAEQAPTETLGGSGASDKLPFVRVTDACNTEVLETWTFGLPNAIYNSFGHTDPCSNGVQMPNLFARDYLTAPFTQETVLAGPVTLTLYASSTTQNASFVVYLDDVAPDGSARNISYGALLGEQRAVDDASSWKTAGGDYLLPYHPLSGQSVTPLVPDAVTRFDIDAGPVVQSFQAGHRLRLRVAGNAFPYLIAPPWKDDHLTGSVFSLQHNQSYPSHLVLPLAPATAFVD
ncbi:MAG: CocE/NonD family hydrolase [Nevskia sp.]|nr:CocE/NonD family hydrolase [Nevskia sp.]